MARRRGRRRSYGYYNSYERTKPREVKGGGIKARSKRGQFAESWWAKRWLGVLGSFLNEGRLKRGRTYARKGQVCALDMASGKINASVQGSRPRPYKVEITLDVLPEEKWQALAAHFSEDASLVARLLNGELPADAEQLFEDLNIKLLPQSIHDIDMNCNCPDYAIPCKHLAAVLYLIAEELDSDPFLLFLLRGKKREEFLAMLDATDAAQPSNAQPATAEPLPADPTAFWESFDPYLQPALSYRESALPAALAKRLGPVPFWQGEHPFIETMEQLYNKASSNALERLNVADKQAEQTGTLETSSFRSWGGTVEKTSHHRAKPRG